MVSLTSTEKIMPAMLVKNGEMIDTAEDSALWVRIAEPKEDIELGAINYCVSVLTALRPDQAERVIKYLSERFSQ